MASIFKQARATFRIKYGTMIFGWEDGSGYIDEAPDFCLISGHIPLSNSILKRISYSANDVHSRLFTRISSNLIEERWGGLMNYSIPENEIGLRHYTIFEEGH